MKICGESKEEDDEDAPLDLLFTPGVFRRPPAAELLAAIRCVTRGIISSEPQILGLHVSSLLLSFVKNV